MLMWFSALLNVSHKIWLQWVLLQNSLLLHQPVSHNQLDPLSRFSMRFPPAVYTAVTPFGNVAGAQRKSEHLAFWRSPKTCSSQSEDCGRARAGVVKAELTAVESLYFTDRCFTQSMVISVFWGGGRQKANKEGRQIKNMQQDTQHQEESESLMQWMHWWHWETRTHW